VHRRAPVRLVRRARLLLVRGISQAATARRIARQPPLPRIRPPRRPRAKSPRAQTARAKIPRESNERPLLRAPALLVLGRLVKAGARNLPELPPVRSRPPAGVQAGPRIHHRLSRSNSQGRRSSRNTSPGHRPRRDRGRRRRLSRSRCPHRRLSRSRCPHRRLSRSRCPHRRLSRSRCPHRRLSRSRCPHRRLSHDRSRRPAAKLRAPRRQCSRVLHLRRAKELRIHSRPLGPYPYGIRRRLQHPSNPFGADWGLAGRPSLLRQTRLLRLSNSNRGPLSRSRRQPHPVGRLGRLLRQVQSLRQDRRRVRPSSSARSLVAR
jgi:hypothetical protein